MAIKYKDFEKREQLRKDYMDKAAEAAKTQANAYTDNLNKETVGKIPTKVSELTNDSNYATESYVNTAIGNISQPTSLPQTYKKKAVTLATSGWEGTAATILDYTPEISAQGFNFDYSLGLAVGKQYQLVLSNTSTYVGTAETATDASANQYVSVKFAVPKGGSTTYIYLCDNTLFSPYGGGSVSVSEGKSSIYYANNSYSFSGNIKIKSVDETVNNYNITDTDVKVNSEVRFTLDEANGKLAGQFGLKKTIDKEAGKLTFTADTLPTSAISGTLEIGETSTEGAAFVEGISSDTAGFVKATEENTFTETQTFNGTESQAGIKTNAIDNENGNRVVYFNGTKQMFGSGEIPTQVRTSEQRLKLERPVSGGTGTEVVEVANLADLGTGGVIRKEVSLDWEAYDGEIDFSFTDLTKNYVTNHRQFEFCSDDTSQSRIRLEKGKKYNLSYNGTTYTATATAATVSNKATLKLEFTIGDKTLIVLDKASASANISETNSPTFTSRTAVAYFSDYSTPSAATTITLTTCPAAYKAVIPYDDSFTNSADVTIEAASPIVAIYAPLFLAPTVVRSANGFVLYVPTANTVTYADPAVINYSWGKICPLKILLTLNRSSGGVVRLSGFANTFKLGATSVLINNTSWQQSGNKYVYSSSINIGANRAVELEPVFDNIDDLDIYNNAGLRFKKSASWFSESPVLEADSVPTGNIYLYVVASVKN